MWQCLELISKKKHYLQKLKEEIKSLEQCLDRQKEQKREYENQNALLYVKLNQYQMIDEENNIITYFTLISMMLLIISVFGLYVCIQMGTLFFKTFIIFLIFDIFQLGCFFGSFKIVKNHFKKKRKKNVGEIQSIFKQIDELRKKRLTVDNEYYILYQKKQKLLRIVSKEERDIQNISGKVINILLSLTEEDKLSLMNLDVLVVQKMEETIQVVIDNDMKRTLNHLENK